DRLHILGEIKEGQLGAIGAEGVGFQHHRTRVQVGAMHVLDKILVRKIEALVTGVAANAALTDKRSQRAVADHDLYSHPGQKLAAAHTNFLTNEPSKRDDCRGCYSFFQGSFPNLCLARSLVWSC